MYIGHDHLGKSASALDVSDTKMRPIVPKGEESIQILIRRGEAPRAVECLHKRALSNIAEDWPDQSLF